MLRLSIARLGAGCAVLFSALLAPCSAGAAAPYPNHPIRLIVPFPPGGVADLIARPVADKLSRELGQPVIVENHGGATGTIGAAMVANAAPDGYTLLFGTTNEIAMSPTLYKSLPYDPVKSFAPVMPVAEFPNVLVISPKLQVQNLKGLIELARHRTKSLSFGSSGVGSTNHLTAEIFKSEAGISILHVPYKGGGPALVGLLGGQVDAMFATLPSAVAMIKSGKLKALAVTGAERSPAVPAVPTAREQGMPGLVVTTWNGVLAPAGTPPQIVARLHDALLQVVADAGIKAKLATVGAETMTLSSKDFAVLIGKDYQRWAGVIREAGIKPE